MARKTSFLISEELLKQLTPMAGELDFDFVYPHLLVAQDKWVQPKLGTKLYEVLMTEVNNDTVTTENALLLEDYIAKPLVHWAMYEAMEFLAIKMVNSGVVQRVVDDGTPISLADAQKLAHKSRGNAEWYTQRLIDYLCAYNSLYPEYSQADPSDIRPEKANWAGGFNLGGGESSQIGSAGVSPSPSGDTYTNPLEVVNPFGDVKDFFFAGGKTFAETAEAAFYPVIEPTFVAQSHSFTDDVDTLIEIASLIDINYLVTFDRGEILLGAVFQDFRSGLPNTYTYFGTGLPASVASVLLTDVQTVLAYTVLAGLQAWQNQVSYDIGPQPLDSNGDPYGSPLPAGITGLDGVSIEGVYPLFGTTVTIGVSSKQTLASMISANYIVFPLVAESGGSKQFFEIPVLWEASRPLGNIQTWNTISSQWEDTGLGTWTTSAVTETIQGNVINYTRYTYNGVDRSDIQIRLIF